MVLAVAVLSSLLLLARRLIVEDRPGFTSVFQGSIRPNSYIGIAAGGVLYGDEGLALTAVAIAAVIPLVNLLSVVVLAHYLSSKPNKVLPLSGSVVKNPLIVACVLGLGMNWLDLAIPQAVNGTFHLFSRAALPMGLLSVGAGLHLKSTTSSPFPMAVASIGKLVVAPVLTGVACVVLGVGGATRTIAVMYSGLPGSASSYILAAYMGGDARLMAAIITIETIASMLTLPVLLILLA